MKYLSPSLLSLVSIAQLLTATYANDSHYVGRVSCPEEPGTMGYVNTTKLNEDILLDVQMVIDGNKPKEEYRYILCPGTTFEFKTYNATNGETEGNEPIIPAFSHSVFTCGEEGKSTNNCYFKGGDFHVYFADLLILEYLFMVGIHFEGATTSSVWGDSHPRSHVYFVDCFFRKNTGVSTAYIHYTPPKIDENGGRYLEALENYYERAQRKLAQGIDSDALYKQVQREEKALISEDMFPSGRRMQSDVKYSMSAIFRDCMFFNNTDELASVLTLGGAVELQNCGFSANTVEKLGVMSVMSNAHAFIHKNTEFEFNKAKLGPVFIDASSFLQLSKDNTGNSNRGGIEGCAGIYLEEAGSNCFIDNAPCYGECCAFGDESCDLYTDDHPSAAPSAAPTSKRPPGPNDGKAQSGFGSGGYTSVVEKETETDSSRKCTGYCIAFAVVTPLVALFGIIVGVVWFRRSKMPVVSEATDDVPVPTIT